MNNTNCTQSPDDITIDYYLLIARLFNILTSGIIVMIIIVWGYMSSIYKAPPFVRNLTFYIGLSNLACIIASLGFFRSSIYDSWWTFSFQMTILSIYMGFSYLAIWTFAL